VRELTTLWAFPLHVYLYKNYNPNHKWEITTLRTLHDLEDQGVMSHNVTYLWQSCHILWHISNKLINCLHIRFDETSHWTHSPGVWNPVIILDVHCIPNTNSLYKPLLQSFSASQNCPPSLRRCSRGRGLHEVTINILFLKKGCST
jgi:hypothetical protein